MAYNILVVDDDTRIRQLLSQYLRINDFNVFEAEDAETALSLSEKNYFDLYIVDVMMPGISGLELTEELTKTKNSPILMLTALSETSDKIAGLKAGADDYLAKPFDPEELLLRVNAILRRHNNVNLIEFGDFQINLKKRELRKFTNGRLGRITKLTHKECRLLQFFANNKNKTISRQDITDLDAEINERTVDVQITRLRRKLDEAGGNSDILQTVRGIGYKLYIND